MEFDPKLNLAGTARKAWTLLDEFKAFALKGNVVDLAIAVVVGGAFQSIVTSLVKNLIMPFLAAIMPGEQGYTGWQFTIRGSTVHVGLFLGDVVHFLLISAAMFIFIVKFLGWILRFKIEEKEAPPPLTKDQELLAEIRDLLKANANAGKGPVERPETA
jgi:large conductance mechanosensitive channel